MRRLVQNTRIVTLALVGVVLLLFCSLALQAFRSSRLQNSASTICSSSCKDHTQLTPVVGQSDNKEKDDKDPTPPPLLQDSRAVGIGLYGVTYSLILVLLARNRNYLRFQTLRF